MTAAAMDHLARSARNAFASLALDRATARRLDAAWIRARLADEATRVVPLWRSEHLWDPAHEPGPVYLSPRGLGDVERLVESTVLLGTVGDVAYFAIELPAHESALAELAPPRTELKGLREVGRLAGALEATLLATARAMLVWHAEHRFCGRCGAPTRSGEAGYLRECVRAQCAKKHFPRTDPAVIVLVVDERDGVERCLLGRQPRWPPGLYSTVAGFVEPGETIEGAVVREVEEETGVRVGEVCYRSSQPWPLPSSLMLGFTARALDPTIRRRDEELEDACWMTRAEILDAMAARRLSLPSPVSIAFRLVEEWFDAGDLGPLAPRAVHGSPRR